MRLALFLDVPVDPQRATWLRRALAAFALAMLAATWRLWTVQSVFPRVPLMHAAAWFPAAGEWLVAIAAVGGLVAAMISKTERTWRMALGVFAVALIGLIVLDQHRLQPWAYQAVLVALVLANCPPERGFALVRLLTVSIYLYSGLSKLDYEFLHTLGQQFVAALLGIVGANLDAWPQSWRLIAAGTLPLAEIIIAVGFCFRRLWPAALVGSVLLHGMLLVVLGPWGLNHSLAVLLWNGYFIGQNILLFAKPAPAALSGDDAAGDGRAGGGTSRTAWSAADVGPRPWATALRLSTQTVLLAAMVLPLLEPIGWWDAWPSWSLYAPNCQRVALLVHRSALGQLGPLEQFAELAADDDPWVRLRADRWSLELLGAPIYPQNRFQLGVAAAVAGDPRLGRWIRAVEFTRSDRLSGQRQHRTLSGPAEISAAAGKFLLNGWPDRRFRAAPANTVPPVAIPNAKPTEPD